MLNSGLVVLIQMAAFHDIHVDAEQLEHEHGSEAFDTTKLMIAANKLGFTTKVMKPNWRKIARAPLPAIALKKDGTFFLVAKVDLSNSQSEPTKGARKKPDVSTLKLLIQEPNEPPTLISHAEFLERTSGDLIFLTSKATYLGAIAKFDFTWFIPAVVKYRKAFGEVLLLSLVLQLIGLATPLFFQVIMDKVLVNHAMQTLIVMTIGLTVITLFEIALSYIRTILLAHTSSKIDVELGAKLFGHLLNLPISYFEARRVGDSVARVRELENIRSFLTGNTLSVILDILFSFIFLGVMFWYSVSLTMIVVISIPLYVIISVIFTPILRKHLEDNFSKSAENQSFLVETVSAVQTVKSMAIEPKWQQTWDGQLARYVASTLSTQNTGSLASSGIQLVNKLVTITIMFLGAMQVTNGEMRIGELIAFNMLASQIANPILRLSQLWNDFQQVGISMSRLSDILNTRGEVAGSKVTVPSLRGEIAFDHVSFRYRPDGADVIRNISLRIARGEIIGIVGRSGSGKSTLTKLIQRLYTPDRGKVLIDGQDLSVIDISSLRRQIGVVLQENTLFNRSIRDNIAVADSGASFERVVEAAKLAGAHDFICELPNGYDTLVGEHGTGLSGGQRQRVTIARTLIRDPRVLIFDEATSALDYESERLIQDNMRLICKDRTVIIIAHRLSAVRDADRIVVMEKGQIAQIGSHDELLTEADGIYRHLFSLQHS